MALSDWGQLAWHPLEPEGGSAVQQSEHEEQERTDWRVPQVIGVLSLHVRHSTPKHELVQSAAPSSKRLASRRPRKTRPILTRIRVTPGARGSGQKRLQDACCLPTPTTRKRLDSATTLAIIALNNCRVTKKIRQDIMKKRGEGSRGHRYIFLSRIYPAVMALVTLLPLHSPSLSHTRPARARIRYGGHLQPTQFTRAEPWRRRKAFEI